MSQAVAPASVAATSDFDRHFRRAVWIIALCVMAGQAIVYAGKAADERSAFIRWRPQVLELFEGVNIYDVYFFPNPPIMPITLYPFMLLPPVADAVAWFSFKCAVAAASFALCLKMARGTPLPVVSWVQGIIALIVARPFMSDLQHGNNNLLILFLVVATLYAWRKGYDAVAGTILAFAITYKVTPGLFLIYFAWKQQWRVVAYTILGGGTFVLLVPSLVLGPAFTGECSYMWFHRTLGPYVNDGSPGFQEINQSMLGVVMRLLIQETATGRYAVSQQINFVSWDPKWVLRLVKALSIAWVLGLGFLCRTSTKDRRDPRLIGEWALVVLTMLFVSERSWKHHYVTILLPVVYLACRLIQPGLSRTERRVVLASLIGATFLMATTSTEVGGLFARGQGHKLAQAYGMFFWAGVVLYAATAWRVVAERSAPIEASPGLSHAEAALPRPHFAAGLGTRPEVRPG